VIIKEQYILVIINCPLKSFVCPSLRSVILQTGITGQYDYEAISRMEVFQVIPVLFYA